MFRSRWVGETDSCSAPGVEVSGGTDRSLLGVDEFQDYSVQHRDGLKVVDLTEDGVKVGFAGKPGHGVV